MVSNNTGTMNCHRCEKPFETEFLSSAFGAFPMRCYCDRCFDVAMDEWHRREKDVRVAQRMRHWAENIGDASFDDTDPQLLPKPQVYERVMGWKYGPRGLIIHGTSGRGKTRCLYALLERLFVHDEVDVRVIRVTTFARTMSNGGRESEVMLNQLIRVPVLALDDLGKEAATDRWESALVELLDARSMAKRPVLVTTNYVGERLVTRFRDPQTGEAVVRRLREFCEPISA